MRLLILAAVSALAFSGTAANAAPKEKGEAKLAKMLQGRVAGAPADCIRTWTRNDMRTIDGTAYVFGHGDVIYVNRTQDPQSIDEDDTLVVRSTATGTQLCRTDQITTFDNRSRIYSGNVFLSEFVPYRRVRR
jgi:hypothetical protein